MSKEELFKKYQEIILKTNGGADDYVVALCRISNLINDYSEEKDQQISDLEAKLAESEETIKNNSHNKWLKAEAKRYKNEYQSLKGYVDQLKQQLAESENKVKGFVELFDKKQHENYEQFCEIMQLKQQLHDLPKKIVGEIRDVLNGNDVEIQDNIYLTDILDIILKKYGGEDESLCCNVKQ